MYVLRAYDLIAGMLEVKLKIEEFMLMMVHNKADSHRGIRRVLVYRKKVHLCYDGQDCCGINSVTFWWNETRATTNWTPEAETDGLPGSS